MRWLSIFLWAGCFTAAFAAPELSVRTDNPTNNMFAVGRRATAEFTAKGWNPGESRAVVADVYDYRDEKVATLKGTLKAGQDGSGSLAVELPTDRFGFFRVRARAGDLSLPKMGTRPAREFTYGVAISPDERRKVPQDAAFAGLHGTACDETRWIGAHQAPYARIFPSPEKRDEWRRSAAHGRWTTWGVSSLRVDFWQWEQSGFSEQSAKWIRDNRDGLSLWKVFRDADGRKVLDEYLARWTRNYRSYPAFEGRRIYEVFWEPDLSAPDKETIVAVAEYVSKAIKAGDPEGLVAMPTLSTLGKLGYHRELFELGLLKHADVFDLHPYVAYPPEQNGLLENVRALKRMFAEYGKPGMPFICTESGYQTPATQNGERLQLDGQVRMHLVLLGEGIWFNCPFFGYDYGGDGGNRSDGDYGLMYNLDYPRLRFGPKAISPRPAFCGLSAFSMLLDGWKAKESVECLGETVLGYVYTNGLDNATLAIWDYGGAGVTVDLPIGREEFEVADIMGNRSVARAKGGIYSVKLSTSPTYIFDPDLSFWEKGMRRLREAEAAAALARENAPVKLLGAEAAFHRGEPAVDIDILNNSDEGRVMSVGTRILGVPDARRAVKATFGPHERRKVSVELDGFRPDPFKTFGLKTFAQDKGGCRAEKDVSVNFLRAEYAPAVGSDVAVGRWEGISRSPVPGGTDDLSAEIGFGWNERFLLVDALVRDDAFRQENVGWSTWNGDAIQFGFAKARLERLSANDYTDSLAQGTTEIDFALTKKGPEGYRTVSFDPYKWPTDMHGKGQIDPHECKMSIERRDLPEGGVELRYRIALPWRYMNKPEGAKEGESVFLAASFNDRDPGDGEYSAIGVFDLKRMPPRHFGRLFLGR